MCERMARVYLLAAASAISHRLNINISQRQQFVPASDEILNLLVQNICSTIVNRRE